jgi:hypothetical protein
LLKRVVLPVDPESVASTSSPRSGARAPAATAPVPDGSFLEGAASA